ncbi:MAG: adenosine deaminase [Anaerolineae bacterium]|nr:adenosine deaminase [Anaerolineae bacterium]
MQNSLPKIELHLHLDCSLSYDAVRQIDPAYARARYDTDIIAPPKCRDLADYLARTRNSVGLLQTEAALRIAARDLVRQLAAENVIYAEIRFAPLLHLANGLPPEQVVEIVAAATQAANAEYGIETRLILCTLRHFSEAQGLQTAQLVERYQDQGVVALDLAGGEADFPLEPHIAAFTYAREQGLNRIAHGGEALGPASVRAILAKLHPMRIGHGVRSIDDPALVEQLIAANVHLEVCPTCNVQIDIYDTLPDHPVDRLYRAGVSLSINTDARATTPTTLTADYAALRDTFGWTEAELLATNLNAITASFAPPELKNTLTAQLRAAYQAN